MTRDHCEECRAQVRTSEAAVSRRACGAVLCATCRARRYGPNTDPDEDGADVRPLGGYGLWEAVLTVAGCEFTGGGLSPQQALSRARLAARAGLAEPR